MGATQDIYRIRRQYNQWVVNQTLEDYALRFTAKSARQWTISRVALTALGTTAFLALEALGATVTLQYGFSNAVAAMAVVCLTIFLIGIPICFHAARAGVDIDLLTRGAGFGYLGSTITSLVYASFTFIFFAIEAAIMAVALQILFGLSLSLAYIICALAVIPIVTHGFTFISRFQIGSQYVWLLLQVAALVLVATHDFEEIPGWMSYVGASDAPNLDVLVFGAAAAVLIALVAQLGEQVDYLRFLPVKTGANARKWNLAVLLAGPGWVLIGFIKLLLGSFIAYVIVAGGGDAVKAADPTHMYSHVYAYFSEMPQLALVLAGLMVVLCQMKINVTNAYAGSIAWSNFFSRLTHNHPGRVVWLVFNVLIALLLMELGIYQVLERVLGLFAVVAVAWLGTLAADLAINKPIGLSPERIEFRRAYLYDINPVGVGSMLLASAVGVTAYLGELGVHAQALAHFLTLGVSLVATPCIALATASRYYIARQPNEAIALKELHECCVCENEFEQEDVAQCPAYNGPICSLCCSLDARCMDSCKSNARVEQQLNDLLRRVLPESFVDSVFSAVGRFVAIFGIATGGLAMLFILVYYVLLSHSQVSETVFSGLVTLFCLLCIVTGVLVWLFLLANDSRIVAQEESMRQTERLTNEILAHEATDRELQAAKEMAETANNAKTRYLSGISHEIRTPLQSILGYAQILKQSKQLSSEKLRAVGAIHRSGEHLADLIEGLLDVSRIEAGRIELRREVVALPEMLKQMVQIFAPLAQSKGIDLVTEIDPNLPRYVSTDGKRLRQILTNLLSNAVKFTSAGEVHLRVRHRSQVAEFEVTDTGQGIAAEDLDKVFRPFERGKITESQHITGTGLGLTIVRLLCDVMGGDVSIESTEGEGTTFKVSLYLSVVDSPIVVEEDIPLVAGYMGPKQRIMVVDDDPVQRGLIADLLEPLGFEVLEAKDAVECLGRVAQDNIDLFLLDVSMPGDSGLVLAQALRARYTRRPIVMLSANAEEPKVEETTYYDRYLVKPVRLTALLDTLGDLLGLGWHERNKPPMRAPRLDEEVCAAITHHAQIGFATGLRQVVTEFMDDGRIPEDLAEILQDHIDQIRFEEIVRIVNAARE